jgi:hypothetical protein
MHDPGAMRLVESVRDDDPDLQRLLERQRPLRAREPRRQRLAVEILHHEIVGVAVSADVVHHADVRMRERGDGAGLALEAGAALGIRGDGGPENFQRDGAIEPRVARLVDLSLSAFA